MTARGHDSLSCHFEFWSFCSKTEMVCIPISSLKRHCISFYQDLNFLPPIPSSPNVFFSYIKQYSLLPWGWKQWVLEETSKIRVPHLWACFVRINLYLMYHPAPGGTGFLTHCLHLWVVSWNQGLQLVVQCIFLLFTLNPRLIRNPAWCLCGSDGTHFMVEVGQRWQALDQKRQGAHLSVGACSLLPAVLAELKAGPRGVQGPMRFWKQTSQKKCPGPGCYSGESGSRRWGAQLGWKQRG